jgi:nucleolar protein 12
MEETKLKFAKRKLRVQRCKTLPGGPKAPSKPTPRPVDKVATRSIQPPRLKGNRALSSAMPITVSVPKGDPTLGSRLASLSKDERKQAKAGDTDRIARRAAKKKAKSAMVKAASKAHGTDDSGKPRIRKRNGGPKGAGSARKEVKKKVVTKRK